MNAAALGNAFLCLPVSVCLLDRDVRYLAVNRKYAELFGATLESFHGKSMRDHCPPELVASVEADQRAFDAGDCAQDHEVTLGGHQFLVSVSPVRSGNAPPNAIAVAFADISLLKKLEKDLASANKRLLAANQLMQGVAETDALTHLVNRYGLDRFFDSEIRRCRREGQPLSVVLVDVDFFKHYNDRYGHLAGDQCLREVAAALRSAVQRAGDCIARYGGEEFIAVLPGADRAGAVTVAEGIQRAIAGMAIRHEGSPFGWVTASMGVAASHDVPHEYSSAQVRDALLRWADAALYRAKSAGRSGIEVCDDAS